MQRAGGLEILLENACGASCMHPVVPCPLVSLQLRHDTMDVMLHQASSARYVNTDTKQSGHWAPLLHSALASERFAKASSTLDCGASLLYMACKQ